MMTLDIVVYLIMLCIVINKLSHIIGCPWSNITKFIEHIKYRLDCKVDIVDCHIQLIKKNKLYAKNIANVILGVIMTSISIVLFAFMYLVWGRLAELISILAK